MQTCKTVHLGAHKGAPRLWIQGHFPDRAGFSPGAKYDAVKTEDQLVLRLSPDGTRVVSYKVSGERTIPIIDLNSRALLDIFPEGGELRLVIRENEIVISALASERRRAERIERLTKRMEDWEPLQVGALAFGVGVLDHALHAGLAQEGVGTQLAWASEIREDAFEQAALHNDAFSPQTVALAAPMQEVAFDEEVLSQLPAVDIVTAGLPCSGASIAGRSKRGLSLPEEHPKVGHLVVAAVNFIARFNPSIIVMENVPPYAKSASACILRTHLSELGYELHEREFIATEWGDLERRTRWCLIAVTRGIAFDLQALVPDAGEVRTLSSILEPLESVAHRFSPMFGLKAKQERDLAAGKGFQMQVYSGQETAINTLTKGLSKNRSTDPKICHPNDANLLRVPTALEHARCKGVPEGLISGLCETTAHELLGQSVCYGPFRALGAHLAKALKAFRDGARARISQPSCHTAQRVPENPGVQMDWCLQN
jgi:DNA (cytosine-5)-methyltransferase 1